MANTSECNDLVAHDFWWICLLLFHSMRFIFIGWIEIKLQVWVLTVLLPSKSQYKRKNTLWDILGLT